MDHILDLGVLSPGLIIVDGKIVDVVDKILISTSSATTISTETIVKGTTVHTQSIILCRGETLHISSNWRNDA